jgi:hypothetical protein
MNSILATLANDLLQKLTFLLSFETGGNNENSVH